MTDSLPVESQPETIAQHQPFVVQYGEQMSKEVQKTAISPLKIFLSL